MSEECPFYSNFLLIVYLGLIAPNVSFGTGANATESNATAIGNQESASGFSTTTLGNSTDAIGVISFSAGNGSQKNSQQSIARGDASIQGATYQCCAWR
jgi:hypothetical protein